MFLFNIAAGVEVLLVAVPAGLVYGAALFFGFDGEWWAALTGLALLIPIDLLWRLASMGGGEDEDGEPVEGPGCATVVLPSGGGHLMFLPMWAIGLVGLPLTAIGILSP